MKHYEGRGTRDTRSTRWINQGGTRFPDMKNTFKLRWRDALRLLLAPAERVHRYRNLHTAMLEDAVCKLDCCEN